MVNKLEEGSNRAQLTQPTTDKSQSEKSTSAKEQAKSKKHKSKAKRRCYWCKEKGHNVQTCPALKPKLVSSSGSSDFPAEATGLFGDTGLSGKNLSDYPVKPEAAQATTSKARRPAQSHNKVEKKESHTSKAVNEQKGFRQRICYNCRKKGHLGKDCPHGNFTLPNLVNKRHNVTCMPKVSNGEPKVTSAPRATKAIWVPKIYVTNLCGPNQVWVPKHA
ncbi:hypothetical protein PVAP13_6NG036824 [Panicum virgatum]|uniref:CCHC-type domain-containing protein n=1 Tax=Panicum virgatum TaxID=38727 RepID=A0A8T0QSL9_PANVG|nr:hypothetical protein PVAP13_6NG036824 [Panicum virgatum]